MNINKNLYSLFIFMILSVSPAAALPVDVDDGGAQWFHETYGRRIGLFEWFDRKDIYYGGKISKDDVWVVKKYTQIPVIIKQAVCHISASDPYPFVAGIVENHIYADEPGKYILIPKGTEISGPISIDLKGNQRTLLIAGVTIVDPRRSFEMRHPTYLVSRSGENWVENVFTEPPILAALPILDLSQEADGDPSGIRLSGDDTQISIYFPQTIIKFRIQRDLFFSAPWVKEFIQKIKLKINSNNSH